jgi:hypothetical protein
MKLSKHDKLMLFEQEFLTLFFILGLGALFHFLQAKTAFYLIALNLGFVLYFWMVYEENVHTTGVKHEYFEHTSSYIMIGQTALALQLASLEMSWNFPAMLFMVISVIMYSVSLSRIFLFKVIFRDEHKKPTQRTAADFVPRKAKAEKIK